MKSTRILSRCLTQISTHQSQRVPPNGFLVVNKGSHQRSFTLRKRSVAFEVSVVCPVKQRDERNHSPRFFFCIDNNSLPYHIVGECTSSIGHSRIESCFFTPRTSEKLDGFGMCSLTPYYCGPELNQRLQIDALLDRQPRLSSYPVYNQSSGSFFSAFDRGELTSTSLLSKFGHQAVNTVNGDVAECVSQLLTLYGIDDSLADFIEWYETNRAAAMKEVWKHQLKSWLN